MASESAVSDEATTYAAVEGVLVQHILSTWKKMKASEHARVEISFIDGSPSGKESERSTIICAASIFEEFVRTFLTKL